MTVGQSTGSSVDRDSTTASRLRPGPPKRHCRPTGGRGARHIQETSDPGGLKSHGLWLHCRRAVSESICPVERMAESRPGRAQCRCREDRAPPESGVDRNEALCRLTATDDTLTTTRRGPSLSRTQPFPKKGCICSADIRIPGPNAPVAAALTPNASTSAALLPCGFERHVSSPADESDGSPPHEGVAVTLASWRPCGRQLRPAALRCDHEGRTVRQFVLSDGLCRSLWLLLLPTATACVEAPGGAPTSHLFLWTAEG